MQTKTKVLGGSIVLGLLLVGLAAVGNVTPQNSTAAQPLSASQLQRLSQSESRSSQAHIQDQKAMRTNGQWRAQWRTLVAAHKLKYTDSLQSFTRYYHMTPARYVAEKLGYSTNQALQMVPENLQTLGERQQTAQLTQSSS